MEFKINIGDPKTGKSVQKVVSGKEAEFFLKKRIGEKISGDSIGFPGYEFEISGGSDYCGFPMRRDVRGTARKKILIIKGVGIRKNSRGRKIRRTVAGNIIYTRTAQINLKVLKQGATPIIEEKKKEGEAAEAEKKTEKTEEKAAEKKEEKPKTEKEKKAEAKEEKPEKAKKEEKKAEDKK